MAPGSLAQRASRYVSFLCQELPSRRVGSPGNCAATDFFRRTIEAFGFTTTTPAFDCIDWRQDGVTLTAGDKGFQVLVSPYSLGCRVSAELASAASLAELEAIQADGKLLLLRGELTGEQLMPKNFPFYNPLEHQHIIALLENKQPAAILTATGRNPEVAGAVYPFPLIEDGDFDLPSIYMTEDEGLRLAAYAGKQVALEIRAERIPAQGCNVIARKGADPGRRVVIFAHIDAKDGTPGALDNAGSVVTLLLLAELLAGYAGRLGIEIVALNGEDYYSAPGEKQWLALNAGRFEQILLGINLDGVGYRLGKTAYSTYDCPPELASLIGEVFSAHPGLAPGEPWYQSDHGLFLMNHRPALALTSADFMRLLAEIVHTPQDRPENVDADKLVQAALALRDLLLRLDQSGT